VSDAKGFEGNANDTIPVHSFLHHYMRFLQKKKKSKTHTNRNSKQYTVADTYYYEYTFNYT